VTADITLNHGDITQPPVLVVDPVTGNVLAEYTPITVAGVPATTVVVLPFSAVTAVTTEVVVM
jgi:hypothetical protein